MRAYQDNNRPVRWYRDSTDNPFYHPSQYNASCKWSNTPQYFHDSTYYLNCISTKNCASHFSEVHVQVAPHKAHDMAFEAVYAPLGGRVYMEDDTVRIRIANYGTLSETNIPVAYQLKRGNNVIQSAYEICPATIASGQTYDYTFNQLLNIPTPTQGQTYSLTIWTDLVTDETRRNDTIRIPHSFQSLPESTYNPQKPASPSFDITRVSFNEFDFECPQLGRGLTDLATAPSWPNPTPDYPVVHVSRGLSDSLIVQVTPLDGTAQSERVMIWVWIDFNRNGLFEVGEGEQLVAGVPFYDNATFSSMISIPNTASYGYMRMRIAVGSYADFSNTTTALNNGSIPSDKDGHNIDVLLFVDSEPPATDLAITQIVSPRSYLVRDNLPHEVSFRIANKGTQPISNPEFSYRFLSDAPAVNGTVSYSGTIQPGTSAIVTLPAYTYPIGVTDLTIWHNLDGDTITSNNQIQFQYNRFHEVRLVMNDNFDLDNKWYAPVGYNLYSHNFWQLGTPAKTRITGAYSDPNAWVTDLTDPIVTGTRGNVSYLYSPIINISQIKADTLSFRLRRNLINGSSLRLEFFNFENKWVSVDADSLTNWYNNTDDACFDGTSPGTDYNYYWISTDLISGDFPERLQFRFVYTTPMKSSATASFGEGCAIDDFHIGRARRPLDAGVVDITYPTAPAYGQTIFPQVVVKNFGTDTLRHVDLGYIYYGSWLPKESHFECLIAPNATDTFAFTSSFIVDADFPDTFGITAFTMIQNDIYYDNDSCSSKFPLSPLENDVSAHSFIYPLDNAVAGDSLQVTIRMRNFGSSPILNATASYIINGHTRVDEDVDFMSLLGRPLGSMEYFNYTFRERFRAPMGVVQLVGIIKSPQNDYIYNDTVTKRIECITTVLDIATAGVIVNTSAHNNVRISLVIENRGSRGANGFEVGFYYDNDSINNMHREVYGRALPLAALQTTIHTFDIELPTRSAGYPTVTGFIHVNGDNDLSNDTSTVILPQYFDLEMMKLILIENSSPDCMPIAVVRNNGNIPLLNGMIHVDVNVNGRAFSENFDHRIEPGQTVYHVLQTRVPKSPNRVYTGSCTLTHSSDTIIENNQSNVIEIRGYWEDVPVVESNELVLDQNYPNPCEGRTTIPFSLPNDANVRFFVIDAMGHVVNSFTRHFSAGAQTLTVDMSTYASGIYYYSIEVDGQRRMKKMILR